MIGVSNLTGIDVTNIERRVDALPKLFHDRRIVVEAQPPGKGPSYKPPTFLFIFKPLFHPLAR